MGEGARGGEEVGEWVAWHLWAWRPGVCRAEGQLELPGERLEVGAGEGETQALPGPGEGSP